jgi:hypothetical protein
LPRARFPVTSGIGVALLVCRRSFGYIVSGSGQPVERSPGGSYHLPQPRGSRVWTEYKFKFDLVVKITFRSS